MSDSNMTDSDVEDLMQDLAAVMEIQGNILVSGIYETHVVIPEGIEIIGEEAFQGYRRLISVELPSSLTSIGRSAFAEC